MMWLRGILGGGGGGGTTTNMTSMLVRHFSRKCAPNLRKINPKVSPQEASCIAQDLYHLIKQHGPVSVSNAWTQAKEACLNGLNSKTHLKLMLKWMRGRKMLRQYCSHVGSSKKFVLCTLPEDPDTVRQIVSPVAKRRTQKPAFKKKKAK